MTTVDGLEIDRAALIEYHRLHSLEMMRQAVAKGDWTETEAALIHARFMASDALQRLIAADVQMLEAIMKGQVH